MKIHGLCGDCIDFNHECDFDEGCSEWCGHEECSIRDRFYDVEDEVKECKGFKSRKG